MFKNIYLVRHGKTEWNKLGKMQGLTNIPLCDEGRLSAIELKNTLKDIKFDVCYTSPLDRAKETASIIIGDSAPILEDSRIIERGLGSYEGKIIDDVIVMNAWSNNMDWSESGVESANSVFKRTNEFITFLKNSPYKNILVVSHAGTIKCIHYNINGFDESTDLRDFFPENTKVYQYKI